MVLNIFSLTISITKRETSSKEATNQEHAKKIFEENQRKVENFNRIRQY